MSTKNTWRTTVATLQRSSDGVHRYQGRRIGRASRQDAKIKQGVTPITLQRLEQLLATRTV